MVSKDCIYSAAMAALVKKAGGYLSVDAQEFLTKEYTLFYRIDETGKIEFKLSDEDNCKSVN